MNRSRRLLLTLAFGPWLSTATAETPFVRVETNQGGFTLQLDPDKAPVTVANFLRYLDEGFYQNTLFHRSIKGFVLQGGGFDAKVPLSNEPKPVHDPIVNEASNGLSNVRGSVAMARTPEPNSATSQFFINTADNGAFLDYGSPPPNSAGYAVFGKVVEGMTTVDAINALPVARNVFAPGSVPEVYLDLPLADLQPLTLVSTQAMYRLLPVADAGSDVSVRSGQVVTLNGGGSSDPTPGAAGPLVYRWTQIGEGPRVQFSAGAEGPNPSFTAPPVGADTELGFRLTVTNRYGNQSVNDAVVRVYVSPDAAELTVNDSPDTEGETCARARVNPTQLWPARGALKAVKIEGVGSPGTYRLQIDRVRSDEPVKNKAGRDRTGPDAMVRRVKPTRAKPHPVDRLWLRAERQLDPTHPLAPGNGRVYTIDFTLTDADGVCAGVVKVGVPVAPAGPLPLDDGPSYDATRRR